MVQERRKRLVTTPMLIAFWGGLAAVGLVGLDSLTEQYWNISVMPGSPTPLGELGVPSPVMTMLSAYDSGIRGLINFFEPNSIDPGVNPYDKIFHRPSELTLQDVLVYTAYGTFTAAILNRKNLVARHGFALASIASCAAFMASELTVYADPTQTFPDQVRWAGGLSTSAAVGAKRVKMLNRARVC